MFHITLASYWSVSGVHELSVNHDQMNVSYHSGSLLVELRVLLVLALPPSLIQAM